MSTPNDKLEAARMRKRWSVVVASEKVGVSVNTFNRWERGLQTPQLSTLDRLCKAFGLPPEELGFGHVVMTRRKRVSKTQEETTQSLVTSPSTAVSLPQDSHIQSIFIPPQTSIRELHPYVEQVRRSLDYMGQLSHKHRGGEEFSRREAITTLVSVPVAVFSLIQSNSSSVFHPEEILNLCSVNVPLVWRLYFEGGLSDVHRILPGYLSQLTALAQHSSLYQKRAARLASQAYQLASLLETQHQNFGLAYSYARRAFNYGEMAEDPNLQTASLIREALVYFYLKRTGPRLLAYERALRCSRNASSLLQGRVYIGLGEVHSKLGHEKEAKRSLAHAQEIFPVKYEEDPNFSYTHFNYWSVTSFEGMMHLNLRRPREAWEALLKVDQIIPRAQVPNRLELTIRQATAAYALNELEQSCALIEYAVTSAKAMGNQLRYDEAYKLYERMQRRWRDEPKLKALSDLFA